MPRFFTWMVIAIVLLIGSSALAASVSDIEEARDQLRDPQWTVRRDAALFLSKQGESAKAAFSDLVDVMRHDGYDAVRRAAAMALAGLGADSVPPLIAAIAGDDYLLQGIAVDALANMGPAARDAVPVLTGLLSDESIDLQIKAISALESIGLVDQQIIDQLITSLSDSALVAWHVWRVLTNLATEAELGERLSVALRSDSIPLQVIAADYLGYLTDPGETGIMALLQALEPEYDSQVRRNAIRSLGTLKVSAALDGIAALIDDDSIEVRQAVVRAIGQIGTDNRDIIARLVMLLGDGDELLRLVVEHTLSTLASDFDYAQLLDELVNATDTQIRSRAAGIIARLGLPLHQRTQQLIILAQDSDAQVRISAVKALSGLGPAVQVEEPVNSFLAELVQSEDLLLAWHAFLAINRIYKGSYQTILPASSRRDLFATIETLNSNSTAIVRRLSTQKLLSLASDALAQTMIYAAQDDDSEIALRAVDVLGILVTQYPVVYKPLFMALGSGNTAIANKARTYFPGEFSEYLDLLIDELTNPDDQIQAIARKLLDTQAPGYLAERDNLITQLDDEFTVEKYYDPVSRTWYFLTRVSHLNKQGEIIRLRHAHAIKPEGETVRQFAIRTHSVLAFNASTAYTTPANERKASGIQIIDGVIIQDLPRNAYTLGIKENNELIAYPPQVSAQAILADGAINALGGFVPLIIDGKPVSQDILNLIANSAETHPRQVIAQFDNLDIMFLSCGGRGYDGVGMTAHDLIRILSALGVRFAYNLDGGGSTSTVVKGELVTQMIDSNGTEERLRPNFLYFK
jgi:HEAT repeat protein